MAGRRCKVVGLFLPRQPKTPRSAAMGAAANDPGSAMQPAIPVSKDPPERRYSVLKYFFLRKTIFVIGLN